MVNLRGVSLKLFTKLGQCIAEVVNLLLYFLFRSMVTVQGNFLHGCHIHGDYLNYNRELEHTRGVTIIIVLCGMLPLGLFLNYPWVKCI